MPDNAILSSWLYQIKLELLYALVRALHTWQHHLLPKEFMIHNDHEALKHLRRQGKLNKRHAKWIEFLKQFTNVVKHKQGKMNVVADDLSRRYTLITMLETKLIGLDCIKKLYEKDVNFGKRLCIRQFLVKEPHEGGLMGNFGEFKTFEILNEHLFWPHMKKKFHNVCERCLTCKLAKSKVSPHGLYTPLLIPCTPRIDISIDFVLGFPKSKGSRDSILVVVDRFSKMAYFISCKKSGDVSHVATLFFKEMVRIQGLPRTIILNMDTFSWSFLEVPLE
ncbi:hypothetical protein CR513_35661, partial [Mucuna pruriens]